MSIFPFFENTTTVQNNSNLPIYSEIQWDYEKNVPVVKAGNFVMATGLEAIKCWCFRVLQINRYSFEIYSWNHGSELENLIGKNFNALSRAEAERYIKECLLVNPYITNVGDITIDFLDSKLSIACTITTIYGDTGLEVEVGV